MYVVVLKQHRKAFGVEYLGVGFECSALFCQETVLERRCYLPPLNDHVFLVIDIKQALDHAGAITTLVLLLGQNKGCHPQRRRVDAESGRLGPKGHEGGACDGALENQILQCMFYLCRLSRKRQEKAAVAGLIPHLKRRVTLGQNDLWDKIYSGL